MRANALFIEIRAKQKVTSGALPSPLQLITDDVNVLLNTDNIVIESATSDEAADLISHVAYVKPESTSTQLTFEPAGSNSRILEITTTFT